VKRLITLYAGVSIKQPTHCTSL